MKKIFLLLIFPMLMHSQDLKIMTYNIRVDFGGDGANNWEFRRDFLAQQIQFYQPDFIGTQEGKVHQLQYIDSTLTYYKFIGTSRDNSKTEGEFSAIFYNEKKFKLLEESTFWLSETPEKKSKGWDAAYERICTYGFFQDIKTKKQFYVFNTHLDHIGITARTNGAKLILEKMKAVNTKNLPVIFTGDFNSETTSDSYKLISKAMNDSKNISQSKPFGPSGTFNNFEFQKPVTLLIDYIFTSKNNITVNKHAVLSDSKDCKYPSDHLPVFAEISFLKS
ncbi:endonuclease/exonuclease/phosphatase family protein [Flavobacterium noncentrifugens]|uniref:Metal-dependent hydrolase, endonuclease/exonuclease/phosphatase family n=1 Tax=Flavobacterium noncentrifugens TaxID=1128970 RepID=A0A1G9A0C1_9FLAO|nr:endonuclease/exonuclease/phosphatase family protein [Flavobacterium noncentrifugens]SDK20822.1 Metal-dependent hydrolase, endonuclease/exonuclease/phosphatase family [Flavobacterium noncentrifugens]